MAEFEFRERNDYLPIYEGIDFHKIKVDKLLNEGYVPYECWMVNIEATDTYEQQITQDNTFIDLNAIASYMDRIIIIDERDRNYWIWFRDETDNFEPILDSISDYAHVSNTMYPREQIIKEYIQRALGKIAMEFNKNDE